MSWYQKETVTCPKCGRGFSTPIDCLEHRKHCRWTRTNFPNGSIWMKHDNSEAGYVKAKTPLGTFWVMNFKTAVHNHASGADGGVQGIHRRGRKWRLNFVDGEGWCWV